MSNGMTFNGVTSSSLHVTRCAPLTPLLPQKQETTAEIIGRAGKVDFGRGEYNNRIIPVDMLVEASSEATLHGYMTDIATWLSGTGYLIFDHDTTIRWYGKVYDTIEVERTPKANKFIVNFDCYPYAEDVTETTGASVGSSTDYGSDIEFYPEINVSLTADAIFVQAALASTGEYVRVEGDFNNGDDFVFNMATGKVTCNATAIPVTLSSLFFGVPTGNQTITVTATSTHTETMDYRKRYLYA